MILLLDLDNTLYPYSAGVFNVVDKRISRYMVERLGFDPATVDKLRVGYWADYGTTLRGIKETIGVDEADFLAYVHDVPVEDMLKPDARLREILEAIDAPKYVFTNADDAHASRVINALALDGLFEDVIDVTRMNLLAKPDPFCYGFMERIIKSDGHRIVFADDFPAYLKPAKARGWTTVHVNEIAVKDVTEGGGEPWVDFTLRTVHGIADVLERIGNGGGGSGESGTSAGQGARAGEPQ